MVPLLVRNSVGHINLDSLLFSGKKNKQTVTDTMKLIDEIGLLQKAKLSSLKIVFLFVFLDKLFVEDRQHLIGLLLAVLTSLFLLLIVLCTEL